MKSTFVSVSLAIVAGAVGPYAQSAATPRAGTVEHVKVHGPALEGNLEGDSPDRDVTIYVPPSYATERARRYPVIYLLHGYGGTDANWTGGQLNLPEIADKVMAAGSAREMIVVMPNAFSLHKGSMYSSSVTSGDWETYVACLFSTTLSFDSPASKSTAKSTTASTPTRR